MRRRNDCRQGGQGIGQRDFCSGLEDAGEICPFGVGQIFRLMQQQPHRFPRRIGLARHLQRHRMLQQIGMAETPDVGGHRRERAGKPVYAQFAPELRRIVTSFPPALTEGGQVGFQAAAPLPRRCSAARYRLMVRTVTPTWRAISRRRDHAHAKRGPVHSGRRRVLDGANALLCLLCCSCLLCLPGALGMQTRRLVKLAPSSRTTRKAAR